MGIKGFKSFFNGHEFFLMVFSWVLRVHFSMDTDVVLQKCGVPSGAIVNAHRTCIKNEIKIKKSYPDAPKRGLI